MQNRHNSIANALELFSLALGHVQGPVLLQYSDAVASLSANGTTAFKGSCAPIG